MKFKKIVTAITTLALLSASICFIGCGDKAVNKLDENKEKITNTDIKEGGTLVVAIDKNPDILNPLYATNKSAMIIDNALFSPLFIIDKNNGYKSYLVDSISNSKDCLNYTIHLKKDLEWHDGKKITADDIIFTMDKILDTSQNCLLRNNFIYNGEPVKYEKVDNLTVKFKLPKVNIAFPSYIGSVRIIPKHIFEGVKNIEKSDKNNNPVGNGPYKFDTFKKGENLTLIKNKDYVLGKPHISKVDFKIINNNDLINKDILSGNINISYESSYNADKYKNKAQIVTFYNGITNDIIMNLKNSNLAKKDVRQAISYALDKEKLLELTNKSTEYATEAYSIFPPDVKQFTKNVERYKRNINKAKELLKKADAENIELKLYYPKEDKYIENQALLVQKELKEIGINIKLVSMPSNNLLKILKDKKSNNDFDMIFSSYKMGDKASDYISVYGTNGKENFSGYSNKEVDELWKEANCEINEEKRDELYLKIQKQIAKDAPVYPICYPKSIVILTKNIGGIKDAQPIPNYMFEDLSKLYFTK